MQLEGFKPNQFTIASFLRVCAGLVALKLGMEIHCKIFKFGLSLMSLWEVYLLTCITNLEYYTMHAKCLTKYLNQMWFPGLLQF
jgi:hypothetical protein